MSSSAKAPLRSPIQDFLNKDLNLLKDVNNFGPSDVLLLTQRLETAAKSLLQISPLLDSQSSDVHGFVSQLIHCFIATTETTRVARCVEKILDATGKTCRELITLSLRKELVGILQQVSSSYRNLKRVSMMMEHSRLVQSVMPALVSLLLQQLHLVLTRLMALPPAALPRGDEDSLYYAVKLCLQVFQSFPDVCGQAWSQLQQQLTLQDVPCLTDAGDGSQDVAVMVSGLLGVLTRKCYARDTSLLAGTAISMAINAAPTPEDSAQCFFTLHTAVSRGSLSAELTSLHLEETDRKATIGKENNWTTEIALVRSVVLGSSKTVLCCTVKRCDQDPPQAFLLTLFPVVCQLCDAGTESQYLAFQLLSLWFQKLKVILPLLAQREGTSDLLGRDSAIVSQTLKRVWISWDSPVDGVAEFVAETFKLLLEVWSAARESGCCLYAHLGEELAQKVLSAPWYARSRYKPLTILIPFIDNDKVLTENGNLKQDLLDCMETNFLAPLASDVYIAFLRSIRNKYSAAEQPEEWKKNWLQCFVSALTSPDSLMRNKVCAYWLPSTLKTLPGTGALLQHHLQQRLQEEGDHSKHSVLLFAWVAVCRNIRAVTQLDLAKLPRSLLLEAIYSDQEDISAETIYLLSTTQKKAEPLNEVEIELFQAALPYCLKVDSAPFRHNLLTGLKKVFTRVRDSCFTAIKRKTAAQFIGPSLQFVDWLYSLLINSLVAGACFQRRRSCLDILQGWMETIVFVETDNAKKGKAQEPTDVLMRYAQGHGVWNFFSHSNRVCLLHCVMDGADEIQESAVHILSKYFPWSFDDGSLPTGTPVSDFVVHLLRQGLELCDSPRAFENRSGALLIKLVYQKFVREQGYQFDLTELGREGEFSLRVVPATGVEGSVCAAFYRDVLLKRIESSLETTKTDALLASKTTPTHGLLQALCECLHTEQGSAGFLSAEERRSLLGSAVAVSSATVHLVLQVLAGGQSGNCPSFASMGVALERLVGESSAEQEVTSSISPMYKLLLSWCWLNLKESCTCLGVAVSLATVPVPGQSVDVSLTADTLQSVGHTFLKVLTDCRHRGALEGCRHGFLQYCTSLMACGDSAISIIPANILDRVLCSLEKDEMTSSVTRRSAGLPYIVQTIVQAEKRCKSKKLLQETVGRLQAVAWRPPVPSDQTVDQAPVHALNVLKAVFSDASLAGSLLPHLGDVMQLVITSFQSSSWAVRNSATQLVSTLVTRMFGQRNRASLSVNTVTLQELSAHFPQLLAFVREKLGEQLSDSDSMTDVQPSLFLVLTLLASLGPASQAAHSHTLTSSLYATVLGAVSSPVYFLRDLSAAAVTSLTPLDATQSCVETLLRRLAPGSQSHGSSNALHGTLLCLDKLLASRSVSVETAELIVEHMLSHTRLVSPSELCPLLCAKSVDVLTRTLPLLPLASPLRSRLLGALRGTLFSAPGGPLQFGKSLFTRSATSLIFALLRSADESCGVSVRDFVDQCLRSADVELRSALLECFLHDQATFTSPGGDGLLKTLWLHLPGERDSSCVINVSNLLVATYLARPSLCDDLEVDLCPDDLGVLKSRFEKLACVQAALLPVEGMVLARQLRQTGAGAAVEERLSTYVCDWSSRLQWFSQPEENENDRLAAAQAVYLAGHAVFSRFVLSSTAALEPAVVSLVEACMLLLEETDSAIRRIVSHFVGAFQWKKKNPQISHMNANLCSKVFLAYLRDEVSHSRAVRQLLFNKLYTPGELTACLNILTQPRTQFLFEHEDNTFFSEKMLQQLDIYNTLKCWPTEREQTAEVHGLLRELRAALPVLESSTASKPVYSVCGNSAALVALTGLTMQLRLISQRVRGHSVQQDKVMAELPSQVSEELKKLLEIPNLHPSMPAFVSDT